MKGELRIETGLGVILIALLHIQKPPASRACDLLCSLAILALTSFGLTACTGPHPAAVIVSAGHGAPGPHANALGAVTDSFFAPDSAGRGGLIRLSGIGRNTLLPDSTTQVVLNQNQNASVAVGRRFLVGRGGAVTIAAMAETARAQYRLPEGAGILTDPITITFASQSLGVELGGEQRVDLRSGLALRVAAAVGWSQVWTNASITSALLDIQGNHRGISRYQRVSAGLVFNRKNNSETLLDVGLRHQNDDRVLSEVTLGWKF